MTLTDEQIRMLAEAEREMDAGTVSFVRWGSQRVLTTPECMKHFGLQQGQAISDEIWRAIQSFNIESIQKERTARKHPN